LHASTEGAHSIGAPRLLHRSSLEEAPEGSAARPVKKPTPVDRYSWADFTKSVKVYVPLEGAEDLAEDAVVVESTDKSAHLTIHAPSGDLVLNLAKLSDKISSASVKRKPGKVVLVLKKAEEFKWYELLKKGGLDD